LQPQPQPARAQTADDPEEPLPRGRCHMTPNGHPPRAHIPQQTSVTVQQTRRVGAAAHGDRTHVRCACVAKGCAAPRGRNASNTLAKGGGMPPTCGFGSTAGLSVCLCVRCAGNSCAHTFDSFSAVCAAVQRCGSNARANSGCEIECPTRRVANI
jgi:hypothetical protein